MFDFKLLVESLLLEAIEVGDRAPWIEELVKYVEDNFKVTIDDNLLKIIEKMSIEPTTMEQHFTKEKIGSVIKGIVILDALMNIRNSSKVGGAATDKKAWYNNVKVIAAAKNYFENLQTLGANKWEPSAVGGLHVAYAAYLNQQNDLRSKIGFAAIKEHENKTILAATIDIVNKRTNSKNDTFITDLFYNPVKYFSGGNIPSDITKSINIKDLIELAVDTRALYEQLIKSAETTPEETTPEETVPESFKYKKNILKEDLIVPLVFAIGAAALAGGRIVYDKIQTDKIHKNASDQKYASFLKTGKLIKPQDSKSTSELYNDTFTLEKINELVNKEANIKWAKDIIDHLIHLSDYQVSKDSTSGSLIGAVGNAASELMSKGVGGSVNWR
jgi:hypothetical protein